MASKLEHLASGRYCHLSSAVPAPLISRTERKIAPVSHHCPLVVTCSDCIWLLQPVPHHFMDLRAGIGTFSVWSLHLQNCTSDYWRHGSTHGGKWVWITLKGHYIIPAPCFCLQMCYIRNSNSHFVFLGFSIIGMLIGFQCLPDSQEDVGARQKKRNWDLYLWSCLHSDQRK